MKSILPDLKGYVKLRLWCKKPERFFNLCAHHRIPILDLTGDGESFECALLLKDVKKIKEICKKTGTKIRITERHGLPFFFYRNKKRKAFFIGILLCGILLSFLSTRVWNIHVEGNYSNSTQMILDFLEEKEIRHGIGKRQVNCAQVASEIRRAFSEVTWVSARLKGTKLLITIQENENPEKEPSKTREPCSLAADKGGVITAMITRRGTPLVKVGETCKKGDLLVEGRVDIRNDAGEIVEYRYVRADADVYVRRTYHYKQSFPLTYEKRRYTGRERSRYFLQLFEKRGEVWLPFVKPFAHYDRVSKERPLYLTENFLLPVRFGRVREMEYEKQRARYTKEEAAALAEKNLLLYLEKLLEKGVQICENNVKIEMTDTMCISEGDLAVVEKIGVPKAVKALPQPLERNTENEQSHHGITG